MFESVQNIVKANRTYNFESYTENIIIYTDLSLKVIIIHSSTNDYKVKEAT